MPSLPFHRTHRCFLWCLAALGFLMSGCQSGDIEKLFRLLKSFTETFFFLQFLIQYVLPIAIILLLLSIIIVALAVRSHLRRKRIYQGYQAESIVPPMEQRVSAEMSLLQTGIQAYKKENLAAAKAIFLALTQEFPQFADGHFYLAAALEKDGVLQEAFVCYRKAVDLRPSYAYQREVDRLQEVLKLRAATDKVVHPDT